MVVKGTCGLCQGGCKVVMTIEDGKLIKMEPDKESPLGRVCLRGALAPELLYGDLRIKKPLIRDGERGEGKFREASWDEAFTHAAKLLKETADEFGAKALASYYGRGILATPVMRFMGPDGLLKRMGSPNDTCCGSICNLASSMITPVLTLGVGMRAMQQDIEHCDYIFAWGKNSTTDDGPQMMLKRIKAAKERGAKLIVIDPRESGIGEMADWWVPVKPGADGALALAMLKLIIAGKKYDKEFVDNYVKGFDDLTKYLDTLTMAQLSEWCGISEEDIAKLTDIFCSTQKITLVAYTGLEYQASAIQNNRAILILWGVTGKYDVEGGIYLGASGVPTMELSDAVPEENTPIGAKEFPVYYAFSGQGQFCRFPKAVLEDDPYPVRGLLIVGGSPVLSFPESTKWREAYKKLKCLLVVDRFMTEDARFADVVFPACSLFEVPKEGAGENGKIVIEPTLAPVGDARNDVLIIAGIAEKLGLDQGYPHNEEELRQWLIKGQTPFGGDFSIKKGPQEKKYKKYETGDLRADGKPGFPTPSGKFEISSTYLEKFGFAPYPEYKDMSEFKEICTPEYPFLMTTGARSNHRMGVFGANIEGVLKVEPYPLVDVNAEDAKELGIEDGEMVRVSTPFGSAPFKAKICGVAKHSIHIPHGGGSAYMPEAWKEGNVNELCTLDYNDPISGFVLNKSLPCKIEKL